MGEFDGKTVLITGGAHGFGRALALRFAGAGADVAVADMGRSRAGERFAARPADEQLERVVREIEALGRKAIGLQVDVRSGADCRRMAEATVEAFGRIDVLCANAGTFSDIMAPAWELEEAEWDVILDVNLKGVWLTTKHVVPHMIERRSGRVVVTASRNSFRAEANFAHYVAAKHGLIGFVKALAIELGPYEINVNAVCPTQMVDKSRPPRSAGLKQGEALHPPASRPYWDRVVGHPDATYAEFDLESGKENLFDRRGQLDFAEVAEAVLWLASDHARAVTGQALPVDNGWMVKRGG